MIGSDLRVRQALTAAAVGDSDEWVRVMGLAAGRFDGRLDLETLKSEVALVGKTISDVQQKLAEAPPHRDAGFRPQEVRRTRASGPERCTSSISGTCYEF